MGLITAALDHIPALTGAAVLIALAVWILVAWTVTWLKLQRANRTADAFEDRFWSGGSLDELMADQGSETAGIGAVFSVAMVEWQRCRLILDVGQITRRLDRVMEMAVRREGDALGRWATYLPAGAIVAALGGLVAALATDTRGLAATGLMIANVAVLAHAVTAAGLRRFAARLADFRTDFALILERQAYASQLPAQTARAA